MGDEVRQEWREAARSLAQNMLEDCNYWISRLMPRKRGLTSEECFHLWSSLGHLRFHVWSKTLPANETAEVEEAAKKLEMQLSEAVARYSLPHAGRSILLVRLEEGMKPVIEGIQRRIGEVRLHLARRDLAKSWDQTEFDYFIQDPMDKLGYTEDLCKEMKLSFSAEIAGRLASLKEDLRSVFSDAVRQYRESGEYPIDAGRPVWPKSFWWRSTNPP